MNIALLDLLQSAGRGFVPWPTLTSLWPQAVAEIDELTAFGFGIERHPFYGAAYSHPAARLCPDQIEWGLNTARIGRQIAVWNRVGSTNDLAARASASRANDGLAILAEEQTSGRGRRGRHWSAPRGSSILMSVLIFPTGSLDDPSWLTVLGAVAVAEVVRLYCGVDARIKWPNDVRVNHRKIAGILVERTGAAVIGLGLNVNTADREFTSELADSATSMWRLTGRTFDRSEIARELLKTLDAWYLRGLAEGPASLDAPVRRLSEHLHRDVEVETSTGSVNGRLEVIEVGRGITLAAPGGTMIEIDRRDIRALRTLD